VGGGECRIGGGGIPGGGGGGVVVKTTGAVKGETEFYSEKEGRPYLVPGKGS